MGPPVRDGSAREGPKEVKKFKLRLLIKSIYEEFNCSFIIHIYMTGNTRNVFSVHPKTTNYDIMNAILIAMDTIMS